MILHYQDDPLQDRGEQKTATATLTIYITDVDDQYPEFSAKSYKGSIREDAPQVCCLLVLLFVVVIGIIISSSIILVWVLIANSSVINVTCTSLAGRHLMVNISF